MTVSLIFRRTLLAMGAAALCMPAMAELADIKSAGKLRVGIDFGAPFYGFVDDKMKPVRSDVEAAALLAKVVRFDDEPASITAAATGQADIVAITPPIIAAIAKKNPARDFETKFILQSYQLGVAMRKGQPELMAAVNGWIKTNLANSSGWPL